MDSDAKAWIAMLALIAGAIVAICAINVLPFYWYGYCEQRIGDKTYITKCLDD